MASLQLSGLCCCDGNSISGQVHQLAFQCVPLAKAEELYGRETFGITGTDFIKVE